MSKLLHRNDRYNVDYHRGFSIIEMMVALLVGVFLLYGLTAMFVNTKQTFNNQSALAQLQNNQILAMSVISNVVQSAGYSPDVTPTAQSNSLTLPLPAATYNTNMSTMCGNIGTGWTHPSSPASDNIITVTSCAQDCTGNGTPATCTLQVPIAFFVCNDNKTPSQPHLVCSINGGTPKPLVDDVSSLSVMYGIDPTPLCSGTVTGNCNTGGSARFYSASSNPNITGLQVVSLYVTLNFVNPLGKPATLPFSRAISLMGRI